MIRNFYVPHNYIYGWNSVENIKQYSIGNTIIVTDKKAMENAGHLSKVINALNFTGIEIQGIINIDTEPTFNHLRNAAAQCRNYTPNTIIALGGGAVIDTAKALWYLSIDENSTIDSFIEIGPGNISSTAVAAKNCRLVIIPTTSGTGSEVTCAAVFSDPDSGTKKLFLSPLFVPDTAILDPALTMTLPRSITAQSGFDALTHAIESYLSTIATPFSRAMSVKAISLIIDNLEKAVIDGSNCSSREAMLYGSSIAGLAISNSCTGLAHSLDQIGSIFKIPHGVAMSPLLIPVIQLAADSSPKALAEIADSLKIDGSSDYEKAELLIIRITDIISKIGLPLSFSSLGIDETKYMKKAETIIPDALEAFATKVFPVPVNREILFSILKKAY